MGQEAIGIQGYTIPYFFFRRTGLICYNIGGIDKSFRHLALPLSHFLHMFEEAPVCLHGLMGLLWYECVNSIAELFFVPGRESCSDNYSRGI